MGFEFLNDLDEFFCEKYADYDKLCVLKGYVMPKMQTTERREDGTDYSYTLPASTMRLAAQKNKAEMLSQLKANMTDSSFSFSFVPVGLFSRIKNKFSSRSFAHILPAVLKRRGLDEESAGKLLDMDEKNWQKICKGIYLPTKNLLFSLALAAQFTLADLEELFACCFFELDYSRVKDTVVSYLLSRSIYNAEMVRAALAEYKVENLFIRYAD